MAMKRGPYVTDSRSTVFVFPLLIAVWEICWLNTIGTGNSKPETLVGYVPSKVRKPLLLTPALLRAKVKVLVKSPEVILSSVLFENPSSCNSFL
jgi:hypothetical protein